MMPSLEKELRAKIRQLEEDRYSVGTAILMEINGIINRADFLTNEQKTKLLELIWKGRREYEETRRIY